MGHTSQVSYQMEAEDGRLAIVSACTDISETMAVQQGLLGSNSLLTRRNEELNFLNNDMPGATTGVKTMRL